MPFVPARRIAFLCLAALLAACAADRPDGLSDTDRSDVARVQSSLDGLTSLRARFEQVAPDGGHSTGTVWYEPGRLRLVFDPPASMLVVANSRHLVAHRDSDGSTTRIALSANPLGLLLTQPLQLSGAITVTSVQHAPGVLQASVARTANPAQGLLTLVFDDPSSGPLALAELLLVDQRGQRTLFMLHDRQGNIALDPGLFALPAA